MNETFSVRVKLGNSFKVFSLVEAVRANEFGQLLIYKDDLLITMFAAGQWTYWELI